MGNISSVLFGRATRQATSRGVAIYHGSVRALNYLEEPLQNFTQLKPIENFHVAIRSRPHPALNNCKHIIPENTLINDYDTIGDDDHDVVDDGESYGRRRNNGECVIPGLLNLEQTEHPLNEPKLNKFGVYMLHNIKIAFKGFNGNDLDTMLETFLISDESNQYYGGEAGSGGGLGAMLGISESGKASGQDVTKLSMPGRSRSLSAYQKIHVSERRLRVGIHNGLTYTEENDVVHLKTKTSKSGQKGKSKTKHTDDAFTGLYTKDSVEVEMPMDENFLMVFYLEYTMTFVQSDKTRRQSNVKQQTKTIPICSTAFHPFKAAHKSLSALRDGLPIQLELTGQSQSIPENLLMFNTIQTLSHLTNLAGEKHTGAHQNVPTDQTKILISFLLAEKMSNLDSPVPSDTAVNAKRNSQHTVPAQTDAHGQHQQYPQQQQQQRSSMSFSDRTKPDHHRDSAARSSTGYADRREDRMGSGETREIGWTRQITATKSDSVVSAAPPRASSSAIRREVDGRTKSKHVEDDEEAFDATTAKLNRSANVMNATGLNAGPQMAQMNLFYQMMVQQQQQILQNQMRLTQQMQQHTPDGALLSSRDGAYVKHPGSWEGEPLGETSANAPLSSLGLCRVDAQSSHMGYTLSRHVSAKLYSAGFPKILDSTGEIPEVIEPTTQLEEFDLNLEYEDHLQTNEIIFQFLAFTRYDLPDARAQKKSSVYFTFQFYRYPTTVTEKVKLRNPISDVSNHTGSEPMILYRQSSDGENTENQNQHTAGFETKFLLDPAFMRCGEKDVLLQYLNQQVLQIDVWDGQSMLLIGSCGVSLRNLCRQKRRSLQVTYELDVTRMAHTFDESSTAVGMENETLVEGGGTSSYASDDIDHEAMMNSLKGRLHLRVANVGLESAAVTSITSSNGRPGHSGKSSRSLKVMVPRRKTVLVDATNNINFPGGSLAAVTYGASCEQQLHQQQQQHDTLTKHLYSSSTASSPRLIATSQTGHRVVRAQHAAQLNAELNHLLMQQHRQSSANTSHHQLMNGDAQHSQVRRRSSSAVPEAERERKLARFNAVLQSEQRKQYNRTAQHAAVGGDDGGGGVGGRSAAFFAADEAVPARARLADKQQRLDEMRTIESVREQTKRENIRLMLSGAACTRHTLYVTFGAVEYFEVKLKNHFNYDCTVAIEILHRTTAANSLLQPVTNVEEWRALKLLHNCTTPIEEDLFMKQQEQKHKQDTACVFMRAKETLIVPFKYTELESIAASSSSTFEERDCQIVFRTTGDQQKQNAEQSRKLVAQVRLCIVPNPPIIDQSFRFYCPENSVFKRLIRLPPGTTTAGSGGGGTVEFGAKTRVFARASDPTVVCQMAMTTGGDGATLGQPHDLLVKTSVSGAPLIKHFLVAVYLDDTTNVGVHARIRPLLVWQFMLHAQLRIDTHAVLGQAQPLTLTVKGMSTSRHVRFYSSHPDELMFSRAAAKAPGTAAGGPADTQLLGANSLHEIQALLKCSSSGGGTRIFQVNMVDATDRSTAAAHMLGGAALLRSWLVCVQCEEPDISKVFELGIPLGGGRGSNKKISFTNPFAQPRTFRLSTNLPQLLEFREDRVEVGARQQVSIGLVFLPYTSRAGLRHIFVFINDDATGKNEETFLIRANYQ